MTGGAVQVSQIHFGYLERLCIFCEFEDHSSNDYVDIILNLLPVDESFFIF